MGETTVLVSEFPLSHPEVLNPNNWAQNGNILSQLLMEIRLILKS